jgi:hypothetical protein
MQVFKQEEAKIQRIKKKIWKHYMQKDYFANQIVEMHCVRHFIMLMIRKKIDVISPQVMCYIFLSL